MQSYSDMTLAEFIRLAASDSSTPGGGGIAALAGSLGAAMASMAINFTVGREKFAEHEEVLQKMLAVITPLMDELRAAVDADAVAFAGIADAYKLPRASEEEKAARRAAVNSALDASMQVPLRVLRCCGKLAETLSEVAKRGNPNLLSDVEVAAIMTTAAARAALVNVYANSRSLATDAAREAEREGEALRRRIAALDEEVGEIVRNRN